MPRFNDAILTAIPRPCHGRPFVCEGNPDTCIAAVIGENPATELGLDWWAFWDNERGFRLTAWREQYEASRLKGGKRPVSNTRLRLDRLRTRGVRCLETNIFFNERLNGPGAGVSNTDLLDIAIKTLPNLKFVIAHGKPAQKYIRSKTIPAHVSKVYLMRHFRSESYEAIDRVANEILAV